jgi:predicted ATPase
MRNGTTNDSSFNKQDNLLLSQTAEERGTMSSTSNYDDDSVNESPRNGRCRRRPDGLSKALNVSLTPARNGVQYYGQQLPHQNARPASNEGQYYGQHSAFDNSIMSMDWGSNDGEASTSERGRKVINHNESLVFDDDISLSLHKVFVDDDSTDRNDSVEKRTLLQESAYQLSTVCEAVDGIVAQLDTSIRTTRQTDTSIRTSSLKTSSSKSTSSSSFYTDKSQDEVYENKVGIWGREKELQILQSRYVSTTAGMSRQKYVDHVKPRHVWISGVSGIGKTSLVDAYLRQVGTKPIICRGAFEENWMNDSKPFPGLVSCFTDLFQDFLDDSHAQEWAKDIRSRLDKIDVTLLVSLIPSLAVLLDVDADDTKYSFETTDRFLFGRLSRALGRILVLTCEFTPVIFSLDDVQWAGDDSLELLKTLLLTDELQNFFFIGSHRSGINVSHSLHKIKAEVAGLFGDDIKLGGIGRNPAKLLVRSHLRHLHNEYAIDSGMLDSLMKLWYSHSNSRIPIFIEHLVLLLYEKNAFIVEDGKWILDSPKILPSSSLSLLVERIESLPIEFDVVLQSAALLDVADFNTDILLVAINAIPKSQEVEIDIDKVEDILLVLCEKMFIEEHSAGRYSFAHNVIKVAAASRIPISTKRKRSSIHWRLATNLKRLKDDTPAMQSESKNVLSSLLIANHLNKGLLSVEDRAKTEMVVKLYIQLAEAAMKRSAFVTARNILETGVAALDKKSKWEESYVLTLKTHLNLARCLFCADELDKAKSIVNTIIANGNHPRDTIEAFDLLISIYRSKMQYEQSKQFALKALNDIWDDDISNSNVEEKFSKIRELVQKKSDADLLVLPDLDHKKISKKMPFLLQLAEISGLCRDYKLQDLAALRMVELTLKYGSYEVNFTGLAFALFGLCVARRHLHGEAYRYGRLAEMMTEKDTPLGRQAIVHHNYHMRHWRNHMRGSRKPLKEICQASIDGNDIENLSFQVGAYISAMLYTGTPFNCQDSIIELYNEKRKHFELAENWNVIAPYNALVKLKGETSRLIKRKYSDEKGVQYDLFFQMVVSVFMNDMEKAENLNSKIFMKPAGCWGSYRAFMEGLIATHYAQSSRKNNFLYQKKASKFIEILTTYTKTGMNNSAHMANILNVSEREPLISSFGEILCLLFWIHSCKTLCFRSN